MDALMFLVKLAYESRYRLPALLTVAFMVMDIRMQLEINIHMRQVRRQIRPTNLQARGQRERTSRESEASNDSWVTLEDSEEHVGDGSDLEMEEVVHNPIQSLGEPSSNQFNEQGNPF